MPINRLSVQWDRLQHCCSPPPRPNSIVTNSELFARLSAAHASHEKQPADSDSLLFLPVKADDSMDAPCPIDTQIGSDVQMLGGLLRH